MFVMGAEFKSLNFLILYPHADVSNLSSFPPSSWCFPAGADNYFQTEELQRDAVSSNTAFTNGPCSGVDVFEE